MEASNIVPIGIQYSASVSESRDRAHAQYVKQAHSVIMHSLATRGRATGPTADYDQPAVVAVMEDMVFSEKAVSLHLIDLAQAFARGESMANMGALAHRMLSACVVFSAHRLADENDAERVATEYHAGDGNE